MSSISVVIPCYNAERTLRETVDSALAQAHVREVVVVDDGSKDSSAQIIRDYGSRVIGHFGPNRGVSAARNTGIDLCAGDWIAFLDSDDLLEPDTFERRLAAAKVGGDVVICDWVDIQDDGTGAVVEADYHRVDWAALAEDAQIATATHVWAPPAALLYRRTVVDRISGFNPRLPIIQDARYLFDAVCQGAVLTDAQHLGARYRVLTGSLSRSNAGRFAEDMLINTREIDAYWRGAASLSERQRQTLMDMYNTTARALFKAGHPAYLDAVKGQEGLDLPMSLHSRLAPALVRTMGLKTAKTIMGFMGRE